MNMLNDFQYKILSKYSLSDSEDRSDYEQAYRFWGNTWREIFASVGSPEAFLVDDFYRPDIIPVLKYKNQIVGLICSTIFNTQNPCVFDMRYFSIFNPTALSWVFERQPKSIMSMEFLTVAPEFRKNEMGFSLAEVLILLSFIYLNEQQIDMAVGVAVKVAGVDKLATNLSAHVIGYDVKRGNLVCNLLGQVKEGVSLHHPNKELDLFAQNLWSRRNHSTHINERRVA